MRKNYIDNIRIVCILLLFPFHTSMIYNNWNEIFYITGIPLNLPSLFVSLVYPWWMTLLFTIAGISSAYALKKRTPKEYAKERVEKLVIPLLSGLILIIPAQSYIADVFYNGYSGGYFEHYAVFFTRFTYLTGQDGGFTPAHLWFMLYLFIISMIMLPIITWYNKHSKKIDGSKVTLVKLLPLFLIILMLTPIIEIGGKSIGESLACFAIGYFLLSIDEVQERLEKNRVLLTVIFSIVLIIRGLMFKSGNGEGLLWDIEQRMVTWFGILAILGVGKRYLNHSNKLTAYFSKAAFPLYYFHQTILVLVGFWALKYIKFVWLQFIVIMVVSFVLSVLCYELFRRIKVTCILFGIKYYRSNSEVENKNQHKSKLDVLP